MSFDRAAYQREYMRSYMRRYREKKNAAAIAQHEERIRVNADAIAAHVRQRMGGTCRVPGDVLAILTALRLQDDDWTPAVQLLQSQGRARWSTPASLLESRVLFLT